jgi:hypothetical protein
MALIFVRVCGVLIALRSLTNFSKVFQGDDAILVFCGQILRGSEVIFPALGVGGFMLITGIGMLKPFPWAFRFIAAYALYVPVNLVLWTVFNSHEIVRVGGILSSSTDTGELKLFGLLGMLAYAIVALGTTAGPAWILYKQRETSLS